MAVVAPRSETRASGAIGDSRFSIDDLRLTIVDCRLTIVDFGF
jgi:hypothetical protein